MLKGLGKYYGKGYGKGYGTDYGGYGKDTLKGKPTKGRGKDTKTPDNRGKGKGTDAKKLWK